MLYMAVFLGCYGGEGQACVSQCIRNIITSRAFVSFAPHLEFRAVYVSLTHSETHYTHRHTLIHIWTWACLICLWRPGSVRGFLKGVAGGRKTSLPAVPQWLKPSFTLLALRHKPGFSIYCLAATQHPQIWAPFLLLCQGDAWLCIELQSDLSRGGA